MKHLRLQLLLPILAVWLFSLSLSAQTHELPRSAPEEQGVPSKAIIALFDSLTSLPLTDMHSVVVMRHGKVIGEIYPQPYAPEYRHTMYSCSKTFVGVGVGLAIADNRLRLDDRVATFFPELLPDTVSEELAQMTVRHLLTMSSGVKPDWVMRSRCTDWIRTFLAKKVEQPGAKFAYDSMVSYMLSAIVQRVTGQKLLDYLQERIFTPMNITEVAWEESPEGINTGGWGLHIQPESLAKFGQLMLDEGRWKGKQLIPAEWVREMGKKQIETGREPYGYQTWRCEYDGAIRADGALGQYVISVLDKDMVVVMTEATLGNGKAQRRLVWEQLLPAVQDEPLPVGKDYQRLLKKQALYALPVVKGKAASAAASLWEGKDIQLGKNNLGWKSIRLHFGKKEVTLAVTQTDGKSYELPFAYKQWSKTAIEANPPYSITPIDRFKGLEGPYWVAGSYGWISKESLQLKAHYVNWVTALELTFRQEKGEVKLHVQTNYAKKPFTITGTFVE